MSTHTEHATDPQAEARGYILTLLALLILTAITVGASYINFGSGNVVIALAIATMKACIVALFFMHLLHDRPVNGIIAVTGFLFLGIFLMFDFLDVGSRKDVEPINLHTPRCRRLPPASPAPARQRPSNSARVMMGNHSRLPPLTPTMKRRASRLFREYAQGLSVDLCFQHFERGAGAILPGAYASPRTARCCWRMSEGEGEPAGCVALRPLAPAVFASWKRLYVRSRFPGRRE